MWKDYASLQVLSVFIKITHVYWGQGSYGLSSKISTKLENFPLSFCLGEFKSLLPLPLVASRGGREIPIVEDTTHFRHRTEKV